MVTSVTDTDTAQGDAELTQNLARRAMHRAFLLREFPMPDFKSITVARLRELLADQPDDALVAFTANYGDRCNTAQALPLSGDCEMTAVVPSAYSDSGFALGDEVDGDGDDFEYTPVLVIF
jgi:hypothetical protein